MNEKFEKVIENFKEATKKKCYMIKCIDGTAGIYDNKIGGIPYVPVNKEYPVDKNGEPMPLFVQINFEECSLPKYPDSGIWQLFVDKNLSYPSDYVIRYYEDTSIECKAEMPKIDLKKFIINESIKIEFISNETYMPFGDYRFQETFAEVFNEIFGTDIENIWEIDDITKIKQSYEVLLSALNIKYGLVGGYADFTQTDPRKNGQRELDECILKIDSQLNEKINIGDCGIAWVLISEENLKNRKFEKAVFDWDCC